MHKSSNGGHAIKLVMLKSIKTQTQRVGPNTNVRRKKGGKLDDDVVYSIN